MYHNWYNNELLPNDQLSFNSAKTHKVGETCMHCLKRGKIP